MARSFAAAGISPRLNEALGSGRLCRIVCRGELTDSQEQAGCKEAPSCAKIRTPSMSESPPSSPRLSRPFRRLQKPIPCSTRRQLCRPFLDLRIWLLVLPTHFSPPGPPHPPRACARRPAGCYDQSRGPPWAPRYKGLGKRRAPRLRLSLEPDAQRWQSTYPPIRRPSFLVSSSLLVRFPRVLLSSAAS